MNTFFSRALPVAVGAALLLVGQAHSQESASVAAQREADARANATSRSTVEVNQERHPSIIVKDKGTVVTEYRDHGKSPEVDVHSSFGTNYQLTQPLDNAPKIRDNSAQDGRLPSVGLKF
ncbi:hypothetical protein PTE30175_03955 [Pandoraea terrae]|uniref:DUF2782 domain-containing protein n=1 Tax=Pandoraea terrae TaxID=1537710 RepID=A0A5E4XRG4_9BURK|nr:hypothetical protein [Pandoraea terrae]VVE38924.1 hypothetical protein PTE30175_03955 [Pandoraea terrae]